MTRPILLLASLGTILILHGCASDSTKPERAEPDQIARVENARVQPATEETFASLVLEAKQPVIVQFRAPWCSHCRALEESLRGLAAAYEGTVTVVSVDIDREEALALSHDVDSVPTLEVYAKGVRVGSIIGVRERADLEVLFEGLSTGDVSLIGNAVRILGPAEPGSACAARLPDPQGGESGTCSTPAS